MTYWTRKPPAIASRAALAALLALASFVALVAAPAEPARAADSPADRKIRRQLAVFEQIVDQVLVDSPNFLVHGGGDNARGIYLPEFGVVVSFEASLLHKDWDLGDFSFPSFQFEKKGNKWIIRKDGKVVAEDIRPGDEDAPEAPEDPDAPEPDDENPAQEDEDAAMAEKLHAKMKAGEKRLYERGRQEIIDALLEYGDTITGLRDDQSIAFVAFLKDSEYFQDNKLSRLVLKARMGDLRAYTSGELSESAVAAKIVREEY